MTEVLHAERETGLAEDVGDSPIQGRVALSGQVVMERVPPPEDEDEEDE